MGLTKIEGRKTPWKKEGKNNVSENQYCYLRRLSSSSGKAARYRKKRGGSIYAQHLSLEKFYRTLQSVKGAQVRRSFRTEVNRLREMQTQASRRLKRPLPSLNLFVRVRLTEEVDVEALVKQFADDPEIEYACLAGIPAPPPQTPDYTGQQDYQESAPDGVDAPYAWFFPGGDGNGVQVCDCEYGFNPSHEDFITCRCRI